MTGRVLGSALVPPVHETGRAGRRDHLAEPLIVQSRGDRLGGEGQGRARRLAQGRRALGCTSCASRTGASPAASLNPVGAISGASEIPARSSAGASARASVGPAAAAAHRDETTVISEAAVLAGLPGT